MGEGEVTAAGRSGEGPGDWAEGLEVSEAKPWFPFVNLAVACFVTAATTPPVSLASFLVFF